MINAFPLKTLLTLKKKKRKNKSLQTKEKRFAVLPFSLIFFAKILYLFPIPVSYSMF